MPKSSADANVSAKDVLDGVAKKKIGKAKKPKDPNAPKKPKNAYILFCDQKRESLKSSFKGAELMKELGAQWKILPEEDKKVFEEKAKEEKQNYQKALAAVAHEE